MTVTREQIAAAIRGVGLTNSSLSELTRARARDDKGKPVSADAISKFLKAGYQGADLKNSLVNAMVDALEAEGVKFERPNWIRIPEGALSRRRGKK